MARVRKGLKRCVNSVWLICGVGDLGHLLIVSGAIHVPGTFDHTLPKGGTRRGSLEPAEMQNVLNWVQGGLFRGRLGPG